MIRTSAEPPSGTVTYLFTDIEGSTALWDRDRASMSAAQARHDEILGRAFEARGGYVFSMAGDGYGAAFATAADAVDAGLAIQRALTEEAWPAAAVVRVRMGIHTGEAEERSGNYYGPAVNQAARLMGAAHGGQLVVSAVTAALVDHRADLELIELGPVALKGVTAPAHLFGVGTDGLPWLDRPLATTQRTAGNLPRLQTPFVGELSRVTRFGRRLRPGGLTTLTGPGGIGKTRLAVEVAWQLVDDFGDGAWLTELAPVPADGDPIDAIASTLSIQPQPGLTTVEAIVDWCFGRRMLLVLDNCEHVRRPMAELAAAILAACPTVALLATSQVPLGIPGEQVEPLTGLDGRDGLELFLDRAAAAGARTGGELDGEGDGSADPERRAAIEAICRRLDGVPLAIELAAARARSLSPTELLTRLDDRLRLLRAGGSLTEPRHQTLRAAVDWSYALLDDDQQRFYDRLSVFAGSFDLDAVVAVLGRPGPAADELDLIDRLDDLVDTSMVTAVPVGGGTRYRMLETLRQYGVERLERRGETSEIRDGHLAHYRDLAERTHDRWFGPDQPEADRTFEREWDNLRAAHRWAVTAERADDAQALVIATAWHGLERLRNEHRTWAAEALALAVGHDATHPTTFAVLAAWAYFAAELDQTIERADQGRRRHPDHPEIGGCLAWLLYGLLGADRADEAAAVGAELAAQLERPIPLDVEFMARMALADASLNDPSDGAGAAEDAMAALCRTIASPVALARSAQLRANRLLSIEPPDAAAALDHYRRAIDVGGDDAPSERLWSLGGVATCLVLADDPGAPDALRDAVEASYGARLWFELDLVLGTCASHLLGRAPRAAATILGHILPRPPSAIGATTTARRAALAEVATWDQGPAWMDEGAAMDRHGIVAFALDALTPVGSSADPDPIAGPGSSVGPIPADRGAAPRLPRPAGGATRPPGPPPARP
jgi:predicted ATPase/class 3 adenylate cyclase